jgi:hypothetical protein
LDVPPFDGDRFFGWLFRRFLGWFFGWLFGRFFGWLFSCRFLRRGRFCCAAAGNQHYADDSQHAQDEQISPIHFSSP